MSELVQSSSCSSTITSISSSIPTTNINVSDSYHHSLINVRCSPIKRRRRQEEDVGGLFVTVFRRSVFGCSNSSDTQVRVSSSDHCGEMEIGVPTDVKHVAHVTFDSFNGFLGVPLEFQPQLPTSAPSASTTVFGVSTNSMQLSFDTRGNTVPTILLMMQQRLYALEGLQAEGIFRINGDNGREQYVRDQLNRGLIPQDVDIHCLAGLIKAWFRELPTGVLDSLSPEEVMQSQTEDECVELSRLLPSTEYAILDWAINLMADVVQFEHLNKMNARNIAMVFAPNMTHMLDPLTALMHAVQVMNFLKTLIEKTLKQRKNSILDSPVDFSSNPSVGNDSHILLHAILEDTNELDHDEPMEDLLGDNLHIDQEDGSLIENIPPAEYHDPLGDNVHIDQEDGSSIENTPPAEYHDKEGLEEGESQQKKSRANTCNAAKTGLRMPLVQVAK